VAADAFSGERRWWQLDIAGGRLRWELARGAFVASPSLATFILFVVALGAILAPLLALQVGNTVTAVHAAARGGPGSAAADQLIRHILIAGAIFFVRQVSAPLLDPLADQLGLRFRSLVFRRTFRAMVAPSSVAHLEDPTKKDLVLRAATPGRYGPRTALWGLVLQWAGRLGGVGGFVLLFAYRWWAGLLMVVVVVHALRRMRVALLDMVIVQHRGTQVLRRSEYLRTLALDPAAAKEVRVFGLASWLVDWMRDEWGRAMSPVWSRRSASARDAALGIVPVVAACGLVIAAAAADAAAGRISVGQVTVVVQALLLASTVASVTQNDHWVELGAGAVQAMLDLEAATSDPSASLPGTTPAPIPQREIRFESVSFAYRPDLPDLYHGLDLTIPVGRSLAIVGANGAGKTTLLKLLARLYDPTAGRITLDGVDLREFEPTSWQRHIAAIFQDFVRYPWSAADNVTLGHAVDAEALQRAATLAGAAELVEQLAEGWDTVLARNYGGADLSGGQWQRIALARALYAASQGAPVLVLDEPTAHLDVRQEAAFYERFLAVTHGLTTVVISHRFSTVRRADRIVVLDDGRVTEEGTHDELVALGGLYAQMFAAQAERFTDPEAADA
jgi:ABC-type multidrug transport system fused ATPase/permease subunit